MAGGCFTDVVLYSSKNYHQENVRVHRIRLVTVIIYITDHLVVVVTPSSLRRLLVILYQDFLGNF